MRRRQRPCAALTLLAITALISGCGSSARASSAGSAASASASNTVHGGASRALARAQAGVKFAQCMRSHGVGRFPDPGASGKFTIDEVANGSSVDTSTPAFTQALSACKDLEPAGFTGGQRSVSQQSAALRFAQCIRDNGVKDFPDPANGEPLVDTTRIPSANRPGGMTILNAAMRKCGAVLGLAAGGQG